MFRVGQNVIFYRTNKKMTGKIKEIRKDYGGYAIVSPDIYPDEEYALYFGRLKPMVKNMPKDD